MLPSQITRATSSLKAVFSSSRLSELGEATGFVERDRVITTERFVPSLLTSVGSREVETIADLQRDFNCDHGVDVNYKPYHDRVDRPSFPALMSLLFAMMMQCLVVNVLRPKRNGLLAGFDDVVVQDGTCFALHDGLRGAFPAASRKKVLPQSSCTRRCRFSATRR